MVLLVFLGSAYLARIVQVGTGNERRYLDRAGRSSQSVKGDDVQSTWTDFLNLDKPRRAEFQIVAGGEP